MATDNHYTKRTRTPDFHSLINRSEKPTFNGQGTAVSTTQYSVTAGRPLLAPTLGQVDWTEDTDGNRTTYAYHPDTGRRTAVTNPSTRPNTPCDRKTRLDSLTLCNCGGRDLALVARAQWVEQGEV